MASVIVINTWRRLILLGSERLSWDVHVYLIHVRLLQKYAGLNDSDIRPWLSAMRAWFCAFVLPRMQHQAY